MAGWLAEVQAGLRQARQGRELRKDKARQPLRDAGSGWLAGWLMAAWLVGGLVGWISLLFCLAVVGSRVRALNVCGCATPPL